MPPVALLGEVAKTLPRATLLALLTAVLVATGAVAHDLEDTRRAATDAYDRGDYAESASLFEEAIAQGARDSTTPYNGACAFALAGRTGDALRMLDLAVRRGFRNLELITTDSDLALLRDDPAWPDVVGGAEANARAHDRLWNSPALATPYAENLTAVQKIAGLSRLWSEVRFNFVNFDLVPSLDWDSLYVDALGSIQETPSTAAYYRRLQRLVAALRDGHSNVYPPRELSARFYARPPLRTRLVGDAVLVIDVYDDALAADGVSVGDELVAIDGVPVETYALERVRPHQCASTPQDLDARTYERALLQGPANESIELTLVGADGERRVRSVTRLFGADYRKLVPPRPPITIERLDGNVAYVALNTFQDPEAADAFEAAFDEIATADALILDVRENGGGNSSIGWRVLACLTDGGVPTSGWFTRSYRPAYRAWNRAEETYGVDSDTFTQDEDRVFDKPCAILIGPRTFSAAEDFAVSFDIMGRGAIIGEPTGGSTGQPLSVVLPGGGSARICTKRDFYPDGRQFVGVGVQPTIPCHQSIEDVRAGRDRALEVALAHLTD